MERLTFKSLPFDIPLDALVVTTTHVTQEGEATLFVTHDDDEEEGATWQFHCGNGDYNPAVLQLVRLDEFLEIDGSIAQLAGLPIGSCARRASANDEWVMAK